MTLKEIADSFCTTVFKSECDHGVITKQNCIEQIKEQKINEYAMNDVLCL